MQNPTIRFIRFSWCFYFESTEFGNFFTQNTIASGSGVANCGDFAALSVYSKCRRLLRRISILVTPPLVSSPVPTVVLMQHSQTLTAIRQLVRGIFAELGQAENCQATEHILLRDDLYCGRRFQADGLQAIWFIEENEIKVYAKDGSIARVLSSADVLPHHETSRRQAA